MQNRPKHAARVVTKPNLVITLLYLHFNKTLDREYSNLNSKRPNHHHAYIHYLELHLELHLLHSLRYPIKNNQ
jgi:hypothetical protein